MGRRDYGRHEAKKPKKDARKPIAAPMTSIVPPPPAVEVLGKHKKKHEEGFPEEEEK